MPRGSGIIGNDSLSPLSPAKRHSDLISLSAQPANSFYRARLPERSDYRFNHLSNGTQVCAGKSLALFIAKAAIATLLVTRTLRLEKAQTEHAEGSTDLLCGKGE
jgi:hypothetical protein